MFRHSINRFRLKSRNLFALCSFVLLCSLAACYDDTFDFLNNTEGDSPFIHFSVVNDTIATTRSGDDSYEYIRNVYPLISEEGGDTLYLIESESPRIDLGCKSQTATRGEKIENVSDIDKLGIYAFPSPDRGKDVNVPAPETELMFDHWKLQRDIVNDVTYLNLYDNEDSLRDEEKWPDYPLDFVAYYPYTNAFQYVASSKTDTNEEGTLVTVELNEEEKKKEYIEQLYAWMWNPERPEGMYMHPTPRNDMYLYYKVPDKAADQVDLMAAYTPDKTKNPCTLEMKHLLTAIRFETGAKLAPCTIKKIAISGIRNSGYMNVLNLLNDNEDNKYNWWETPEKEGTTTEEENTTEGESTDEVTATEVSATSLEEDDDSFWTDLKNKSLKETSYVFDFGEKGLVLDSVSAEDPDDPNKMISKPGQSLLGDENQPLLLLPQELGESATLHVELKTLIKERTYTIKRAIDLKGGKWKPGTTITYRLSGEFEAPIAELYLVDGNGMPLETIKVGYAGGETNYKVGSYIYYISEKSTVNNNITKLPMPWKASIVAVENGTETPIIWDDFKIKTSNINGSEGYGKGTLGWIRTDYNDKGYENGIKNTKKEADFTKYFGDIERIEYEHYNANFISEAVADNPVRTVVTIPKISMSKTSLVTKALQGAEELGSEDAPYNLAARGIGLANNGLKIFNKNKSQATEQLEREYDNTEDYYYEKDINTANCYIVSAPGWYSFPLVYGNAVKDGYVNYGAYVFKSKKNGESFTDESKTLKGENQILQYAINHNGDRIQTPYILHGNGIDSKNIEAELLWEDQICLIEDVDLVDASNQTLTMFKNNGNAPQGDITYSPQKKIRFHIRQDNIRQGNAVIVLKEKDKEVKDKTGKVVEVKKGDVIWSWHIWVTPNGTGTASNYHPVSHQSTIYGSYYQHGTDAASYESHQDKWTEIHNHYIYNRCIGLVMAGDKYDFTPPKNIYIKYEPVYDALYTRLTKNNGDLFKKIYGKQTSTPSYVIEEVNNFITDLKKYYGEVGTDNPGTHPVYVKVNQADLSCEVKEDYYMLYQWGRKDPMISRYENIYDGNHCRIDPTDKRHLGEHSEIVTHEDWITYGIKHPDEFMWGARKIGSGTYYANLWDFSLGTDEINCMYPDSCKITNFFEDGNGISQNTVTQTFYYKSDRVFKSVYDPSPVGQKIPVGPVINMLTTDENKVTNKSGQRTLYKYDFTTYSGYGHSAKGMGGLFTECKKDADGNYIIPYEPDTGSTNNSSTDGSSTNGSSTDGSSTNKSTPHTFWIPAFGYRFGDGFTKQHGNEFVIWEGGALTREGNGHTLYGNYTHVKVYGESDSKYNFTMGLPVLPIFDEPQWIRTW